VPSTSKKQHNFMAAVANNPKFAKKVGVPKSVGEEFVEEDKGMKFGKGSSKTRADLQAINKPTVHRGKMKLFAEGGEMAESKKMVGKEIAFMKKKGAPKSMLKHEMAEMKGKKKMAMGGISSMPARDTGGFTNLDTFSKVPSKGGISNMPYMPAKPGGFSTGVTNKLPPGSRPGVGSRPGNMGGRPGGLGLGAGGPNIGPGGMGDFTDTRPPSERGMRKGGLAAGHKQADGIAKKGKTRGMEVKMAGGGLAAGHKQADGIAKKGKTKAMQVKMAGGGKMYGGKC